MSAHAPEKEPITLDRWQDADDLRWAARGWAGRIGVKLSGVTVRPMHRKWASMSTGGRMTVNSELLDVPKHLGEYVIVHELIHLLAPNHGKVFKSFLYAYYPDWEQCDAKLREYAALGTVV